MSATLPYTAKVKYVGRILGIFTATIEDYVSVSEVSEKYRL